MLLYAKVRLAVSAAVCLFTTFSCSAAEKTGPSYVYFAVPGAVRTLPLSINDSMSVTGYWIDTLGTSHGFVRDGQGKITPFDPFGSLFTEPLAINDRGEIAGFFQSVPGYSQGFVRSPDGSITTFNPGGRFGYTSVFGFNDRGEVLGAYTTSNFSPTLIPFVREPNGDLKVLSLPPSLNASLTAINDLGEITGGYSLDTQSGGFVRTPGGMITTFAGFTPAAINIAGLVAGLVSNATSQGNQVFVRCPDGKISLSSVPGYLEPYLGFNAESVIAGTYYTVQTVAPIYQNHGFLRFPQGTVLTFDVPGAVGNTTATSINDFNVVTGSIVSPTLPSGFLRIP